jgi:hypothetical protein
VGGACRANEREEERVYTEGEPKRKRLLGRPRRRWIDNIKIYLVQREWGSVDWIGLAQDKDK